MGAKTCSSKPVWWVIGDKIPWKWESSPCPHGGHHEESSGPASMSTDIIAVVSVWCIAVLKYCTEPTQKALSAIFARWHRAIVEAILSQLLCFEHVVEGSLFKSRPTRKQRVGQEPGARCFLLTGPHLLQVLHPPHIVPPNGHRHSGHESTRNISHSDHSKHGWGYPRDRRKTQHHVHGGDSQGGGIQWCGEFYFFVGVLPLTMSWLDRYFFLSTIFKIMVCVCVRYVCKLCVCKVCVGGVYVEVRGQLYGVWSLLPPLCGLQELNLGHLPWAASAFTDWAVSMTVSFMCQLVVGFPSLGTVQTFAFVELLRDAGKEWYASAQPWQLVSRCGSAAGAICLWPTRKMSENWSLMGIVLPIGCSESIGVSLDSRPCTISKEVYVIYIYI